MNREMIDGVENLEVISDINVTPFIDIMLALLIIFMVTAPLMLGGVHINLPKSGGDPMPRPENPMIVSLNADNKVFLDKEELPTAGRHQRFQSLAEGSASGEIFVRGDGEVKYGRMMELMAELGRAGFARVTLVTDIRPTAKANKISNGMNQAADDAGQVSAAAGKAAVPASALRQ